MTTGGPDFCTPELPPAVGSTLENVEEWNPVEAGLAPAPPKKNAHAKEVKPNKENNNNNRKAAPANNDNGDDEGKVGKDDVAGKRCTMGPNQVILRHQKFTFL